MTQEELLQKEMKIAEEIFGTESDPDQMPITKESVEKLNKLSNGWLESEFDESGEPISWAVVMPTQKDLAEKFLNKEITEKQLLELTQPADTYDAVYLVSVITVPEHRGKGLAGKVTQRAIKNMPVTGDVLYFVWPASKEGEIVAKKLEQVLGKEIKIRK